MADLEQNSNSANVQLDPSWRARLEPEFSKPYMKKLKSFLVEQRNAKKTIFPKAKEFFAALDATPFDRVKIVFLGQDPYHGPGQAHGLCFSVQPGVRPPPSLQNIYKELSMDVGFRPVKHGYLRHWAEQGVLLLNATLSVESGKAGSHQGQGWEEFTDEIIERVNREREHVVFMLWGSYAQKKGARINSERHLILMAPHPSPLSAHKGFLGCRHFSQANDYLVKTGQQPIDWQLPETPK